MTEAERHFCQAAYNVADTLVNLGDDVKSKSQSARLALADIEQSLGHNSAGLSCYVLKAYCQGLLGHDAEVDANLAHIGNGANARIVLAFVKMTLALQKRQPDEAIRRAREMISHGYNPQRLLAHPISKPLRNNIKFKKLFE